MCAPSMPLLSRAEHEVVARRAPRRLLGDLDVGHAVLGEEALLLGDDQRRGIDQRDVAEDRLRHLRARPPARCARRTGNCVCTAPSSAAVPAVAFRKRAAADAGRSCWFRSFGHSSSDVLFASISGRPAPASAAPPATKKPQPEARRMRVPLRTAALLIGPSLDRCRRLATACQSRSLSIQASCQLPEI